MPIYVSIILLVVGMVLLIKGADFFVEGASKIARMLKIPSLVIGLTLTLVHLTGMVFTGTSVNPARSIGPALLTGGTALSQLWVFIVAPLVGGILAALFYKLVINPKTAEATHVAEVAEEMIEEKKEPATEKVAKVEKVVAEKKPKATKKVAATKKATTKKVKKEK